MIDNQHTSTKSCFNFRVQKGSSDEQSVFDLKKLIIPKRDSNFYSARDSDRTIKFLNNWSLGFTQFAHWHGKLQPQVIFKINHSQGLIKKSFCFKNQIYFKVENTFWIAIFQTIETLFTFFNNWEAKKNKNNNILNPLLRPPLSNKPSFSEEEIFNNKPPSVLFHNHLEVRLESILE